MVYDGSQMTYACLMTQVAGNYEPTILVSRIDSSPMN